jgi:hypothetical protein
MLSTHFSNSTRATYTSEQMAEFNKTNNNHLEKLKYLCKNGKPKQTKYAIYVLFNNFEKTEYETILYEIYNDSYKEANLKNEKTFITSMIARGHISYLIPNLVGKNMKEFIIKTIAKDLLLTPSTSPLNIFSNETSTSSIKRKNNLKLAGKWCENKEELPFNTRARVMFHFKI